MPITPPDLSRFQDTQVVSKDNIQTFGLWNRPDFMIRENLDDDQILKITIDSTTAGRPDLIAQQYYKTALLEWIVVMFNRPLNPLGWPEIGKVIEIPKSTVVFRSL